MLPLSQERKASEIRDSDGVLRGPFPYYRNESFQYLCSDVLSRNRISLTGKEAIKTFYFSKDSGLKPAAEQNYFCLPTSLRSHSPTADDN